MGRPAIISDEDLITIIDEYHKEKPNEKIKFVDIEKYCNSKGIAVSEGSIRKRNKIVDYIKLLNIDNYDVCVNTIYAYVPLDINKIFSESRSMKTIKEILIEREKTIKVIINSAIFINEENKKLKDINKSLKSINGNLRKEVDDYKEKNETIISKNNEIEYLKQIIEQYVYPEIAKVLLNNEYKSDYVSKKVVGESIIDSKKDVDQFVHSEAGELLDGFDE